MLIIIILTVYPFLYIMAQSFSAEKYIILGTVRFLPKGFNIQAYKMAFEHPSFWRGYLNTLYYTSLSVVISIAATSLCAYPLSKTYLPGRKFLMKTVMFTMFFGGGLIPNFLLVKSLGLLNTVWALTLPGSVSAWNVMIMITFFRGIPEDLDNAAFIDGLGPIGTLWYIILPLSKPILATMMLFFAVGQWNNWFGPLIYFNNNEMYPITLFLRNILVSAQGLASSPSEAARYLDGTEQIPAESLKSASIILVTFPILVLYPFVQKYFVKGVLIGSVK
jgi:putative aldouronate transport system permease protein